MMRTPPLSPGTILASCLIFSCGPGGGAESGGSTSTGAASTTGAPITASSTTGGDDPTGGMTGTTTSSPTTSEPGPTTGPETTSAPETTAETTGPIDTTAATTTDNTGTGTTGPASACADLDEADCTANADCMAIFGAKINVDKMCLAPAQFLGCIDSVGCDDAHTTACKLDNPEPWQFPSSCIPDDFEPCRGTVTDMMCR